MSNPIMNYRTEPHKSDNYDTWKVQAQAILIRNGLWDYVCSSKVSLLMTGMMP